MTGDATVTGETVVTAFREAHPERGGGADPIATGIVHQELNAAATLMKKALVRTAFSPIIYEALDFAVALYDDDYALLAQAPTLPAFMGTLGFCVRAAVEAVGGTEMLRPGDVILYNDPYGTGSHPQDAAMIVPVFVGDELIGFSAVKAHWLDIAGKDPYCTDTVDVFQEGTIFPGVKLYDGGALVDPVYRMVVANTRMPDAVIGDINAMVASTRTGGEALAVVAATHGVEAFRRCVSRMYQHGEAVIRSWTARLPDGSYTASGSIDSDGVTPGPVPFSVRVVIDGSTVRVDYSDAPAQVAGPINCPLPSTVSASRLAVAFLAGAAAPNEGHFRAVEVVTRRGTLFHPTRPAPCFMYGIPADHAIDLVLRAIGEQVPGLGPAGSGADINALVWWGTRAGSGEGWTDGAPHPVGQGGDVHGDGGSALMYHSESATRFTSTEIWESRNPWLVERCALAPDSAGVGRHRGGLGLDLSFRVLEDCYLTSALARTTGAPYGMFGGGEGRPNGLEVRTAAGEISRHALTTRIPLAAGTVVHLRTGSGGGYGPPSEREPAAVHSDVREGYTTEAHARSHYPHAFADDRRSAEVLERLPAGEGREPGMGVDEPADPAGVDARVLAQGPADGLAQEEVRVGEVGLDRVGEQPDVGGAAGPELRDDGRAAQPAVGVGGPAAHHRGE